MILISHHSLSYLSPILMDIVFDRREVTCDDEFDHSGMCKHTFPAALGSLIQSLSIQTRLRAGPFKKDALELK